MAPSLASLNSINDALSHTQHQSTIYKSVGPVSAKYTRPFTREVLIISIDKHYRGGASGPAGPVLALPIFLVEF